MENLFKTYVNAYAFKYTFSLACIDFTKRASMRRREKSANVKGRVKVETLCVCVSNVWTIICNKHMCILLYIYTYILLFQTPVSHGDQESVDS